MKIERLICPKCGNTENFLIDVQLTCVATYMEVRDDVAQVDISFPNDLDIPYATCSVCNSRAQVWGDIVLDEATPNVMCPSCKHYVEGIVVEVCGSRGMYPACFRWKESEVEIELST